jgi:hypothetical protein
MKATKPRIKIRRIAFARVGLFGLVIATFQALINAWYLNY